MIRFENVTKTYPRSSRPALGRRLPRGRAGRVRLPRRHVRLGQVDPAAARPAEERATGGRVLVAGRELAHAARAQGPGAAPPDRHACSRTSGCCPTRRSSRTSPSPCRCIGKPRATDPADRARDARAGRPGRQGEAPPARAVRWRAAARGDRPRVRQPAADPARRRAHRQPRPRRSASGSCSCSTGSTAPAPRSSWPPTTPTSSTRCASASIELEDGEIVRDQTRGVYGSAR